MADLAAVRRVGTAVAKLGGAFMLDKGTTARGEELGLSFPEYYFMGRGGVLGDVDADVVAASFTYFPVPVVRMMWESARAKHAPSEVLAHYVDSCHAWGGAHLAAADGLDEMNALAERVIAAASPLGAPLFSGWRAVSRPDGAPARAAQVLHVLREQRGGAHACAVLAAGLTPLEAVIGSGELGVDQAKLFGWPEPYPDPADTATVRASAEDVTDRMVASAYDDLTAAEVTRLAELVEAATTTALD